MRWFLEQWSSLEQLPLAIDSQELWLEGNDIDPPFARGPGQLTVQPYSSSTFLLIANEFDVAKWMQSLRRAHEHPYSQNQWPRLMMKDGDGINWNCGYVRPRIESSSDGEQLSGHFRSLVTHIDMEEIDTEHYAEVFVPIADCDWLLDEMVPPGHAWEERLELQKEVSGYDIQVSYQPGSGGLRISATLKGSAPRSHIENCLCQPLRILSTQLIYPRLALRAIKGKGDVWVRPTRQGADRSAWLALWVWARANGLEFWDVYFDLLELIIDGRDKDGHHNFEQHPIARYYCELFQADGGSLLGLELAMCVSLEGVSKILDPSNKIELDTEQKDSIESFRAHMKEWKGDAELKGQMVGSLLYRENNTSKKRLESLVSDGTLSKEQVDIWSSLRNKVAHGELTSPYISQERNEEHTKLLHAIHSVTMEIAKRHLASKTSQ